MFDVIHSTKRVATPMLQACFHNVHGKCRSRQLRQLVLICSDKSGGGGWWGRSRGALGSVAKGHAVGGALLGAAYLIASACKK